MRTILELLLALLDVFLVLLRGRPSGLRVGRGETIYPAPRDSSLFGVTQAPPRLLTLELYFAHLRGASVQQLSQEIQAPAEWVMERLEAARDCVEFEMPVAETGSVKKAKAAEIEPA
ncbi:MAG TPA: hypothetical protein VE621_16725 [Bryobacteraceae bacterium]|nr:hypothetical protein [Bryobacteraceae bacterium]